VSREGVDEFLATYARLDGHRRASLLAAPPPILPVRVELATLGTLVAALVVGANLAVALRRTHAI
jgi:hypothetical protein